MLSKKKYKNAGFSMIELLIAMAVVLVLLGIVSTLLASAMSTRRRESRKTDALTSAQAALSVMSREISNSGFGLNFNGLVPADSSKTQLHFRANVKNIGSAATESKDEDLTYFYDSSTKSIVRYDPNDSPNTSVIVNRISEVSFQYFNYTGTNSTGTEVTTPSTDTGRITLTVKVILEDVQGQPSDQKVTLTSDITLRNSEYMLNQY